MITQFEDDEREFIFNVLEYGKTGAKKAKDNKHKKLAKLLQNKFTPNNTYTHIKVKELLVIQSLTNTVLELMQKDLTKGIVDPEKKKAVEHDRQVGLNLYLKINKYLEQSLHGKETTGERVSSETVE